MKNTNNIITVGFDAKRIVSNPTGLGNYGRTLVNALLAEEAHLMLRLYAPDKGNDDLRGQVRDARNICFCYPSHHSFRIQRDWWRHHGMVRQLVKDGVEVYHGLSGELPVGIQASGVKSVATVHDLIFLRYPEYYSGIDAWLYKRKFLSTCQEADVIIAISERTKQDILAFSHYPEDQIKVIYQGCDTNFKAVADSEEKRRVRATHRLPRRFILYVGTMEERKNLLLAVKALRQLPQEISLVAVGKATSYVQKVRKYISENGLQQRVRILHSVNNDDLPAIYQQAECFVYPSRYEGFGIPVVEAIQSGLPVVACTGSCLEEAGGPDCIYVHPDDHQSLAQAIASVLQGAVGRTERINRSKLYVKRFENLDVAAQVANVYHMLLRKSR